MSDMANDTASEQPAPAGAALEAETLFTPLAEGAAPPSEPADGAAPSAPRKRRRRGSRGGRRRPRPQAPGETEAAPGELEAEDPGGADESLDVDVPSAPVEAVPTRPKIGDTRPAPAVAQPAPRRRRRRGGRGRSAGQPVESSFLDEALADPEAAERRRGRERKGRPAGRYLMCVHVRPHATQIAVLEGRALIEHYVSRPEDDAAQIDGNIYLGRVQNVLPGMEAAFVDIGTPKNAVLYRGDVQYDPEDVVESAPRIEQMLKARQTIMCQVTKNPIGTK